MTLAKQARSHETGSETARHELPSESSLPARSTPQHSDFRELSAEGSEATTAFELTVHGTPTGEIASLPLALGTAIEQYSSFAQGDSEVLHALRTGDLLKAVLALLQESVQQRREIESARENFEELRGVVLANQEQTAATLAVSDDQRLELLEAQERTRTELLQLEGQLEQAERDFESELLEIRQQRNDLDLENGELRTQLAVCRSSS